MKIFVKVRPNSNREFLEKNGEAHFRIFVKEPPIKGRANEAVVKILADYFGVSKTQIRLIIGSHVKNKIFEVLGK